jgi:hypothetical protein
MPELQTEKPIVGNFDVFVPSTNLGSVFGMPVFLPGHSVVCGGWAFERSGKALTVTVRLGGSSHEIPYGYARHDVAQHHGRSRANSGFEGRFTVPDALPPGECIVEAIIRGGDDGEFVLEPTYRCIVAAAPTDDPAMKGEARTLGRFRFIRDTRTDPYPFGWSGRQTIRPRSVVHAEGWITDDAGEAPRILWAEIVGPDTRLIYNVERIFDGEANFLTGTTAATTGFRLVADTRVLLPGLYDIAILAQISDETVVRGPRGIFQVAPHLPDPGPLFLPITYQPARGAIERFEPLRVVRGGPVAIRGWAVDPANGRGSEVFVAIDSNQPLPLASRLRRDDVQQEADKSIGFSGIADTADLCPGTHTVKALLLDATGAAWYEIGRRELEVSSGL